MSSEPEYNKGFAELLNELCEQFGISARKRDKIFDAAGTGAPGRIHGFKPEFFEQAKFLCQTWGATDAELTSFFNVSTTTWWRWCVENPDLRAAVADGKEVADERVKRALYQRAVGYEQQSEKVFMPAGASEPVRADIVEHVPADVGAAKFWLGVRSGWKDGNAGVGAAVQVNLNTAPTSLNQIPPALTLVDVEYCALLY